MNRLIYIIDNVIDQAIKDNFYYPNTKFYGLCEAVTKDGKTFPARYKGDGEYDSVDLDDTYGVRIYHKLIVDNHEEDENKGFGIAKEVVETYGLRLICYGDMTKVNPSTANISYQVSTDIASYLPSILTAVQKANLNIRNGSIKITGKNLKKDEVYSQEFQGLDSRLGPDKFLFAIDYAITIKFLNSCLDDGCDTTAPMINLRGVSCENINHPEFGLSEQQIQDCYLCAGECADGQAKNTQGDILAIVPSGGVGMASDVIHTQTDGSPAPLPAGVALVCTPTPAWQLDFEANAFLSAGLITDATLKLAIRQLVYDLKFNDFWNYIRVIRPYVGGTALAHSLNLKNPNQFALTFVNGWTHNSLGITGDGATTYAKTGWIPMTELITQAQLENLFIGTYGTTVGDTFDMGSFNNNGNSIFGLRRGNDSAYYTTDLSGDIASFGTPPATNYMNGWSYVQRNASQMEFYQGTTLLKTLTQGTDYSNTGIGSLSPYELYIGAINVNDVLAHLPTAGRISLDIAMVKFLNSSQRATLNTIIQTFQTTLGRQL